GRRSSTPPAIAFRSTSTSLPCPSGYAPIWWRWWTSTWTWCVARTGGSISSTRTSSRSTGSAWATTPGRSTPPAAPPPGWCWRWKQSSRPSTAPPPSGCQSWNKHEKGRPYGRPFSSVARSGSGSETQGPGEEGRHLGPDQGPLGTELIVGGRIAAGGDAGGGDRLDVALEDRVVVVTEGIGGAGPVLHEGTVQEGGHLTPGDGVLGSKGAVGPTLGDPGLGEGVDVGLERRTIVIGEGVGVAGRQAQGPHQEGSHFATAQFTLGAELRVVRRVAALG